MENAVVYLFGSGLAFFVGSGAVVVSTVVMLLTRHIAFGRASVVISLIGLALVGLSAPSLPLPVLSVVFFISITAIAIEISDSTFATTRRKMFRQSVVICWLVLIGMEIPYVVTPKVDTTSVSTIAIVGDSISAGVGRDETAVTWPKILSRTMGWSVVDQSQMGATVKSALEQAKGIPDDCPIVVLEIGGNDVLGSTNVDDFSVGLDRLFSTICRADRIVLMFELPLPPGYGGFGRVQRRLSRRYNVRLIPKRILMGIIARPDATIDSVHLSQSGHESMANTLSTILVTK